MTKEEKKAVMFEMALKARDKANMYFADYTESKDKDYKERYEALSDFEDDIYGMMNDLDIEEAENEHKAP